MLGDIGDYIGATFGEVGHHPWQAAGALFGVPGWDPAIGGLFNNRPGGALLSPTGNFTSSAWHDMYQDNPNNTAGLDAFHRVNSIADVVAPMIAGGYAMGGGLGSQLGSMGGGGGLMGGGAGSSAGSSAMTLGPDISGSGGLFGVGSGMGGSTLPGTVAPEVASTSPYASAFGGTSMAYPFTMSGSGSSINPQMLQQAMSMMQQGQQRQQPQGQQMGGVSPQLSIGNPNMRPAAPLGPSMPYASFGNAGAGAGIGNPMGMAMQMLASKGLLNG